MIKMDKEELRREKLKHGLRKEKYREENEVEFLVKFNGTLYVEALDEEEAIEKAKNNNDLFEYIDYWKAD